MSLLHSIKARSRQAALASIETQQGTVRKVYKDGAGNVTAADVVLDGQAQTVRRIANTSGVRVGTGQPVKVNFVKGNRHARELIGVAGATAGGVASAASLADTPSGVAGVGAQPGGSLASDLSSYPFLLWTADATLTNAQAFTVDDTGTVNVFQTGRLKFAGATLAQNGDGSVTVTLSGGGGSPLTTSDGTTTLPGTTEIVFSGAALSASGTTATVSGLQGPAGPAGATGATGPTGPAGANGTTKRRFLYKAGGWTPATTGVEPLASDELPYGAGNASVNWLPKRASLTLWKTASSAASVKAVYSSGVGVAWSDLVTLSTASGDGTRRHVVTAGFAAGPGAGGTFPSGYALGLNALAVGGEGWEVVVEFEEV